jgi:hypothetical protein
MKSTLKFVVAVLAAGVVFTASAADLIVTAGDAQAKSGISRVALDIATDGNVSGFNFVVVIPADAKAGSVDVSKCLSDLPKGFTGDCRVGPEGVYVFAMASDKSVLPAGVVSLGSLGLPANLAKSEGLTIDQLVFADVNGDQISSTHQIAR